MVAHYVSVEVDLDDLASSLIEDNGDELVRLLERTAELVEMRYGRQHLDVEKRHAIFADRTTERTKSMLRSLMERA